MYDGKNSVHLAAIDNKHVPIGDSDNIVENLVDKKK